MSRNFDNIDGLDTGEVAFVIELLAAMCTTDEIKKKFFESFSRTVLDKTIKKIQLRYGPVIKQQMDVYLNNIKGNPLAHTRVRLDILYRVIQDCLEKKASHSVRVGDASYEVVYKADNPSAIAALRLAMNDINAIETRDMNKKEKGIKDDDDDDDDEFEVDTGIA